MRLGPNFQLVIACGGGQRVVFTFHLFDIITEALFYHSHVILNSDNPLKHVNFFCLFDVLTDGLFTFSAQLRLPKLMIPTKVLQMH